MIGAGALAGRGDAAAGREHARLAQDLGRELGMTGPHGVAPRAEALLARL